MTKALAEATRARVRLLLPPAGAKSSASLYDHLIAVERQTGVRDPRLIEPELAPEVMHLWGIFWSMYAGAGLTFVELRAWSAATGEELSAWEAETLRAMSAVAVKEAQSGN